ncbi:MAG: acyl--CoA ligase [Burkholderiales bacterium]|nr:acyl--CoA ligase [Burkholderiales bacterium]
MAAAAADALSTVLASIPWSRELRTLAARYGGLTAVRDEREALSYAALCARAHALAAQLLAAGVQQGESVATLLPNCLASVWSSCGVTLSGAAETPLAWGYTADEITWSARLAGFRIAVTRRERAGALRSLGIEPILVEDLAAADPGVTLAPVPAEARGRILFSSGTTGRPKGFVYSHGRRWIGNQLQKAALPFAPDPGSRILLMTPYIHGAGLLAAAWYEHGGEVLLHDGVDAARVRAVLEPGGLDALFAPPTVLAKLAAAFGETRYRGLRCVFTGTAPLAPALYARASAMFGPVVRITYGKSECVNPITVLAPAEVHAHFTREARESGCCLGWPGAGVEIEIRAVEGECLAAGFEGEVWLRARHMSEGHVDADGYHPHPGGWHRSGDLGRTDARGRLWLTGRVADVIKTGGYRVNPDEIESCLAGTADCGSVCVTSLPSDYWGEVIVAAAEGACGDWSAQARQRVAALSRHKQPRAYVSVAALPRNAQGKVSRRALREIILGSHDFVDGPYPLLTPRPPAEGGEAPGPDRVPP